jgi:hypothetical protein
MRTITRAAITSETRTEITLPAITPKSEIIRKNFQENTRVTITGTGESLAERVTKLGTLMSNSGSLGIEKSF